MVKTWRLRLVFVCTMVIPLIPALLIASAHAQEMVAEPSPLPPRWPGGERQRKVHLSWSSPSAGNYCIYTRKKAFRSSGYEGIRRIQCWVGTKKANAIDVVSEEGEHHYLLVRAHADGHILARDVVEYIFINRRRGVKRTIGICWPRILCSWSRD